MIARQYRLRLLAAASGLAALSLLGAACGGHSGGHSDAGKTKNGSSTTANGGAPVTADQQLKLAQCLRKNGVNMPDPKPGGQSSTISLDGSGLTPEKLDQAMKTCRSFAGIPAPKPLTAAQQDKMLKFAACMRAHGVNMPDPKFDGDSAEAAGIPAGGDMSKVDAASKACARFQ